MLYPNPRTSNFSSLSFLCSSIFLYLSVNLRFFLHPPGKRLGIPYFWDINAQVSPLSIFLEKFIFFRNCSSLQLSLSCNFGHLESCMKKFEFEFQKIDPGVRVSEVFWPRGHGILVRLSESPTYPGYDLTEGFWLELDKEIQGELKIGPDLVKSPN